MLLTAAGNFSAHSKHKYIFTFKKNKVYMTIKGS